MSRNFIEDAECPDVCKMQHGRAGSLEQGLGGGWRESLLGLRTSAHGLEAYARCQER